MDPDIPARFLLPGDGIMGRVVRTGQDGQFPQPRVNQDPVSDRFRENPDLEQGMPAKPSKTANTQPALKRGLLKTPWFLRKTHVKPGYLRLFTPFTPKVGLSANPGPTQA